MHNGAAQLAPALVPLVAAYVNTGRRGLTEAERHAAVPAGLRDRIRRATRKRARLIAELERVDDELGLAYADGMDGGVSVRTLALIGGDADAYTTVSRRARQARERAGGPPPARNAIVGAPKPRKRRA